MQLIFFPYVAGPANWEAIEYTISSHLQWSSLSLIGLILIVKMIATAWSLATGASGGVFAPSLLLGGCLGCAYGILVQSFFTEFTDAPAGYVLVGMGALVVSVTQAPLTAITIIFELGRNFGIVLPVIIAASLGIGVFNHLSSGSIYTMKLIKRGILLDNFTDKAVLEKIKVARLYRPEDEFVYEHTPLKQVIQLFLKTSRSTLPVVDSKNRFCGLISFWDLKPLTNYPEKWKNKTAHDFCSEDATVSYPDESLYTAFSKISSGDFQYLPIVNDQIERKLIGKLMQHELLEFYKKRLTLKGLIK